MRKEIFASILTLLFLLACKEKDEPEGDPGEQLVFQSLTADRDTISSGQTTKIEAVATGYMLTYKWSATVGDILGSGSIVNYAVSPCQIGTNRVTCEVKDGNNKSETKSITIVVQ